MVKFREVIELPAEPEDWELQYGEYSTSAAAKAERAWVTERFAALADGWIDNSWCVFEGDPEGVHLIKVYVNGHFIKRFQFGLVDIDKRCGCCRGSDRD